MLIWIAIESSKNKTHGILDNIWFVLNSEVIRLTDMNE